MIDFVRGKVVRTSEQSLILEVHGVGLTVLVPSFLFSRPEIQAGREVKLYTVLTLQLDRSRVTPILIGFLEAEEREFYEVVTSVGGLGPKIATKMMASEPSAIAAAVERGDERFLKSLPGLGKTKAQQLVVQLRGKLTRFLSMMPGASFEKGSSSAVGAGQPALLTEIYQLMDQLGYSATESGSLVSTILARHPEIQSAEEFLTRLYQHQ